MTTLDAWFWMHGVYDIQEPKSASSFIYDHRAGVIAPNMWVHTCNARFVQSVLYIIVHLQ